MLDLLTTYPRRWVDRTNEARISDLVPGQEALVLVTRAQRHQARRCATGARWSTPSSATAPGGCRSCSSTSRGARSSSREGLQIALFGKADMYRGGLQMTNPIVDLIGDRTGRIVPIYPQSEKAQLTTWEIAGWVENALERCQPRGIADPVPDADPCGGSA